MFAGCECKRRDCGSSELLNGDDPVIDQNVADGIATVNALIENATRKYGSDLRAVIADVRNSIEELSGPQKEAALKALDDALPARARIH
jgi:hypothetical protein